MSPIVQYLLEYDAPMSLPMENGRFRSAVVLPIGLTFLSRNAELKLLQSLPPSLPESRSVCPSVHTVLLSTAASVNFLSDGPRGRDPRDVWITSIDVCFSGLPLD